MGRSSTTWSWAIPPDTPAATDMVHAEELLARLDGVREVLSKRNIMGYGGTPVAPDEKTKALLELVEIVEELIKSQSEKEGRHRDLKPAHRSRPR